MAVETTLEDIVSRLRQGRFPNEQAISQGIVLRLLQDLGWNTWDTTIVWPEFQTGEGRVDFALCHPPSKPAVFIEVKQPGMADDAVRQALEYAFHTGVPFVVLTDGKSWSFYLPAEQGTYEDRRVYKLDLFERSPTEAAKTLQHYLARARIESGEALVGARSEYRDRARTVQARSAIPESWRELLQKGDELLVDLLATEVETRVGVRPSDDDVIGFLNALRSTSAQSVGRDGTLSAAPIASVPYMNQKTLIEGSRNGTLSVKGKTYSYHNAKEAMVTVLSELAKTDGSFLERCSQHPDAQGRKRRYIARTTEELYPDRPDLRDFHAALPGGWLVATNLNNVLKKNIIKLACDVAGLSFGKDIIVDF